LEEETLWQAINEYVIACGGNPHKLYYGGPGVMREKQAITEAIIAIEEEAKYYFDR
jgi:hypothetical protein